MSPFDAPARPRDPLFDEATYRAVMSIVEKVEMGLREACLLQKDGDPGAKPIEWYRGAAAILIGLRGEIDTERMTRIQQRDESPEDAIARNLEVLAQAGIAWSPTAPPDPNEL